MGGMFGGGDDGMMYYYIMQQQAQKEAQQAQNSVAAVGEGSYSSSGGVDAGGAKKYVNRINTVGGEGGSTLGRSSGSWNLGD